MDINNDNEIVFNTFNFYDRIELELKYLEKDIPNFEYIIYYEKTSGVHKIETK